MQQNNYKACINAIESVPHLISVYTNKTKGQLLLEVCLLIYILQLQIHYKSTIDEKTTTLLIDLYFYF